MSPEEKVVDTENLDEPVETPVETSRKKNRKKNPKKRPKRASPKRTISILKNGPNSTASCLKELRARKTY